MSLMKNEGFTLLEVLWVCFIIGIMASIGVPAFMKWVPNIKLREVSREAYLDFQFAKMEAIKRNQNVAIIFDPKTCTALDPAPSPGGGYTIFVDEDSDHILDGGEETLKNVVMPSQVALCKSTFPGDSTAYQHTGLPTNKLGKLTFQNSDNVERTVALSIAGNVNLN